MKVARLLQSEMEHPVEQFCRCAGATECSTGTFVWYIAVIPICTLL